MLLCPICNAPVFANARRQILAHTTAASGGKRRDETNAGVLGNIYGLPSESAPYHAARVCDGSVIGARP